MLADVRGLRYEVVPDEPSDISAQFGLLLWW